MTKAHLPRIIRNCFPDIGNLRRRRAVPTETDHCINIGGVPSEDGFNGAIEAIPDPACDIQGAGLLLSPAPEPNALDAPCNDDMDGYFSHQRLPHRLMEFLGHGFFRKALNNPMA